MNDLEYKNLQLRIALSQTTILLHQSYLEKLQPELQAEQSARAESALLKAQPKENGDGVVGD